MYVDRRLYRLGVALVFLSIFNSLAVHHDCLSQLYFRAPFSLSSLSPNPLHIPCSKPDTDFFCILISFIPLSSIHLLQPALVKAPIFLTVLLYIFSLLPVPFLSSLHALSCYSGSMPGLIQKESHSQVGPGVAAICLDL